MKPVNAHHGWWAALLFIIFSGLSYVAYRGFFLWDSHIEEKTANELRSIPRLTDQELALLEEGDIIMRRGFGLFSDWIAKSLNTGGMDVTHAGILTCRNGNWQVIHALSSDVSPIDGMQVHSLNKFLHYSQPGSIAVVRIKNFTPTKGVQIAEEALYYLSKKVPFDHHGNIDEDSELYCTELIWTILEKKLGLIQLPSDPEIRKKIYYSMRGLYDTAYFDMVLNQRDAPLLIDTSLK